MFRFKIILLLIFLSFTTFVFCQTNSKHVYVKSYTKSDGTYVPAHYRTAPNNTNTDNFSTKPNVNPYTGKPGWIEPDNKVNYSNTSPSNSNYTYQTNTSSENFNGKYIGAVNSSSQKVITYKDGQEIFTLCESCNDVTYNKDLYYSWYNSYEGVKETQGISRGTLLDGEYKFHNNSGKILVKMNYKKGLQDGDYFLFNDNGQIKEEGHYTNGVLDYLKFINENIHIIEWKGQPLKQGSIKNIYNLSTGAIIETSIVRDSFLVDYKFYYETNGKIKKQFTKKWVKDSYNGLYNSFYENGMLEISGNFIDDFQSGDWKYFNKDGKLTIIEFKIFEDYDIHGILISKGSKYYNSNKNEWIKDGKWIFGSLIKEIKYYEDGIEIKDK